MAVAIFSNWRAWVVTTTHEEKNWVIVPVIHEKYRAVLIQCDEVHTEWYRDAINRYSLIEGRLERYLKYLHKTGVSMGLVKKLYANSPKWDLVYQSHKTDEPFVTDRPYMIYNLDDHADAIVVQRALDHRNSDATNIEHLLQELIGVGVLKGSIVKYEFL